VFVVYEAIAMLFALVVYVVLAARETLRGAAMMAAGVLVSIVAAAVQATGAVRFTLIWDFDHNGAFHLIQMVGLLFLLIGLRTDLVSRRGA
jgi:TctA family transporter